MKHDRSSWLYWGAIVDYQIAQVDLAFATGMLLGASRVTW